MFVNASAMEMPANAGEVEAGKGAGESTGLVGRGRVGEEGPTSAHTGPRAWNEAETHTHTHTHTHRLC